MNTHWKAFLVVSALGLTIPASAEDPYQVAWSAQVSTSGWDDSKSVAMDGSGNAYITGSTGGDLGGPNAGYNDAYLSKFDASGNELWTAQIGTALHDHTNSVAVDASGNVYIGGGTDGDFSDPNAGSYDTFLYGTSFLSKFDASGNNIWTRQFDISGFDSWVQSAAVDASGDLYVTGSCYSSPTEGPDVFLRKFDGAGNEVWTTQIGTSVEDLSWSVAVDAIGNAYITGWTYGSLGGPNGGNNDAFLSKFDADGAELWTIQIGTPVSDAGGSVAVDASGNVYVSGGINDADALIKFDAEGNEIWMTQSERGYPNYPRSVAVDPSGNVYTAGTTGSNPPGYEDACLSKFDASGNELWTTQIGASTDDVYGYSVAVDTSGDLYFTGLTWGDVGGPNAGSVDAFLVKYEVPEPATLSLLALGGLALLRKRK